MRVLLDSWTPDQPSLAGGSDRAFNVLPAKQSYRPVASLSAYSSNSLGARCQGGASFRDSAGNVHSFAGDAAKLYRQTAGSTSFLDVSKVGGYSTAPDSVWCFVQYLDKVYATNFADPIQVFDLFASTKFADLSASAPKCRYLLVVKNFLLALNTNDPVDGNVPNRAWWSKEGDPSSWPTPGTDPAIAALSDKRDLSAPIGTGWIYGGGAGLAAADAAVLTENGLYRVTFGGDQVFSFDLVEGARGTRSSGSIVQHGGTLDYLAEDGFYTTDGASSIGIGASILDKWFYSDPTHGVDQTNLSRISAANDPINKICMWAYPSVSGGNGNLDHVLVRNWDVGRWSLITGLGDLEVLMALRSLGYSLETLDGLSPSIDTLPFSLDSRQLTGGLPLFGAFKTDHKLYTFTGPNLAASLTLTEQGHPSGARMSVTEVWPLVEVPATVANSPVITFTPLTRNRQNDVQVAGSAVAQNATGFCPVRINARYVSGQLDIAAGGDWQHAIGADVPDDKIALAGMR